MAMLNNQMVNYSWKNTENIWETINLGWFQGTCFLHPISPNDIIYIYIAGFSCRLPLKPTVACIVSKTRRFQMDPLVSLS